MSTVAGLVPIRRVVLVRVGLIAALALVAVLVGGSISTDLFPFTACLAIGGLLAVFAFFDASTSLLGTVALLLLLGVTRRTLEYGLDTPASTIDPVFLVAPLVTLALMALAMRRGALRDRTPLTSVVLGISVVGLVGAANPLQGTPVAAAIGVVIFMTPVLWFWIARVFADDERMTQVFALTAIIAAVSAVYGLAQTSGHFFSFDQAWIDASEDYASLRIQSVVRAFGFASSAAEYGKLLGAGIAILAAWIMAKRQVWWLPPLGVLGAALFLSGLRTTLVLAVVAMGLIWGARRGASILQLTIYGVIGVIVLLLLAAQVTPSSGGTDAASVLADRQVEGLTDPFNPQSSTLQVHIELAQKSLRGMASAPIGTGTATITLAGKRFGNSAAGDTDLADAAIAFGLIGVVLYLALCVRLFRVSHLLAVRRADALSLAALGIVVVSSLQWLNGGLYGANVLAWFTFGWIDRASAKLSDEPTEPSEETERARAAV